ncbi:MAG: response regulator transcription factor [Chloroflexi bacterium]|nr:MAG: response regulator transcription factor [Chloroflexota bacterium]
MSIRILIVDDHSVVREGLRMFLGRDPELHIVGEAASGIEAIEKARHLRPDIVLMDLLLPGMNGIAATAEIRRELPETGVLILTSSQDHASVIACMRAGAIGYMIKDAQGAELRTAIKSAAAGKVQLSSQAAAVIMHELCAPAYSDALTGRETDVLILLAQGHSNKEIARVLLIAEHTVKTHIRHILSKLSAKSRTQAILTAIRLGLVSRELVAS